MKIILKEGRSFISRRDYDLWDWIPHDYRMYARQPSTTIDHTKEYDVIETERGGDQLTESYYSKFRINLNGDKIWVNREDVEKVVY